MPILCYGRVRPARFNGQAENSVDAKYCFHVKAMKIGLVLACVGRYSRRVRRGTQRAQRLVNDTKYARIVSAFSAFLCALRENHVRRMPEPGKFSWDAVTL